MRPPFLALSLNNSGTNKARFDLHAVTAVSDVKGKGHTLLVKLPENKAVGARLYAVAVSKLSVKTLDIPRIVLFGNNGHPAHISEFNTGRITQHSLYKGKIVIPSNSYSGNRLGCFNRNNVKSTAVYNYLNLSRLGRKLCIRRPVFSGSFHPMDQNNNFSDQRDQDASAEKQNEYQLLSVRHSTMPSHGFWNIQNSCF
jgi:hypothetical protein